MYIGTFASLPLNGARNARVKSLEPVYRYHFLCWSLFRSLGGSIAVVDRGRPARRPDAASGFRNAVLSRPAMFLGKPHSEVKQLGIKGQQVLQQCTTVSLGTPCDFRAPWSIMLPSGWKPCKRQLTQTNRWLLHIYCDFLRHDKSPPGRFLRAPPSVYLLLTSWVSVWQRRREVELFSETDIWAHIHSSNCVVLFWWVTCRLREHAALDNPELRVNGWLDLVIKTGWGQNGLTCVGRALRQIWETVLCYVPAGGVFRVVV